MRNTTLQTLVEAADAGIDVHFITADLGFKVLDPFRDKHPKRFTNGGVSEANMVSVAAGLALAGKRPVCYSMVPFLFMRAFEQVRVDVVAHGLPVLLVGVGGGLSYGHEGVTHHAIEDLAMARALPGLTVIAPGDPVETAAAVRHALALPGPTYLRLGRNGDPVLHKTSVDVTKPLVLRGADSRNVVVATGHIVAAAVEAADLVAREHGLDVRVISVPMLKPVDDDTLAKHLSAASSVVTVEEHSVIGGLGSHVAELMFARRILVPFAKLALPDAYCRTHGTLEWLRDLYGLSPRALARQYLERFGR